MTLTQISSRGVEDALRWSLGASGTDHYTFTGPGLTGTVNDPAIYLTRGQTYIFENNNSSNAHPFYIKTNFANGGTNDAYNTGVTNNGGGGGTEIKFTVPHDSPDVLYYQCSSHAMMYGQFNITGSVANGSITSAKIADGTITSTDIADGTITNADINASAAIAGSKIDPTFTGTGGVKLPVGNTAQRVNTTALIRFNSEIGLPEYYNGTSYVAIDSPPVITSVTPTEVDNGAGGNVTFTIAGDRFGVGVTVKFISNNGTEINASSVTRNSSTQLTAVAPVSSFVNAQEPYDVQVTNSSGLSSKLADQINVDMSPVWTTASGTVATILDNATGTHATLAATDADGDTVTFSWTGAGGMSLNASTGVISGDPTDVTASTTHTFTANALANSKSVARSFNIIVNPYLDGSSASRAATSAKAIKTLTGTSTSGLYWLKPTGFSYPAQFFCEMSYYGGGWTFVIQRQVSGNGGVSNYVALNSYTGTQNRHSSNFSGVQDNQGNGKTIQNIWDGIVGSGNNAAVYCEELQTSGGSYHERQAYTSSTDGPQFSYTDFIKFFNSGDGPTGVKVSFNNGSSSVTGKQGRTWGNLQTINNGLVDQELYFCNGNGNDNNWSFGLMQGGTPYPRTANAANGGGRNSTTRWATWAIRE